MLSVDILRVVMLCVIILSVVISSVVAPCHQECSNQTESLLKTTREANLTKLFSPIFYIFLPSNTYRIVSYTLPNNCKFGVNLLKLLQAKPLTSLEESVTYNENV
jgi:hypothetical protein